MRLAPYIKALDRLKAQEGLSVESHVDPNTDEKNLWIDNVLFASARLSDIFQPDFSAKGILVPKLTPEEKDHCRKHGVSYLTTDGSFYLVRKKSMLLIEPLAPPERMRRHWHAHSTAPTWLTTVSGSQAPSKPTDLVSPNAFSILDVIFRLPEHQLQGFSSGLQFAKSFDLYQPKLSTMMLSMRVHSLVELRQVVSKLSPDWWIAAFRYPAIRRVFTPFFLHAQPYHSTLKQSEKEKTEKFHSLMLSAENNQLAFGPTEVTKEQGLLRDQDFSVWGSQTALQKLKRELRLVPGIERNTPTWFLATPLYGFRREAILSHLQNRTANVFRAIWDLSYGDARLREVQVEMLAKVLK